mgnify:CR=1 FL=1
MMVYALCAGQGALTPRSHLHTSTPTANGIFTPHTQRPPGVSAPCHMDQAFEATTAAGDHEALEMARLDQEILALQYDDGGGGQHDPSFATNSELEHLQKVRNVYGEESVV